MAFADVEDHDDAVRTYEQVIRSGDVLLSDGANGTRLRFETGLELDPVLDIAGLASDGRSYALQAVSGEYVAIAAALGMPIQLDAASGWISPERLAAAGRAGELEVLNRRCVEAAASNRDTFTGAEIFVAGVIAPKADGYAPTEIPSEDEAAVYHEAQAAALASASVDVLYGETLSTAPESLGMARAMAATARPYAIGPVIDRDGRLPDGTPLEEVIAAIDSAVTPRPLHFFHQLHPPRRRPGWVQCSAGARRCHQPRDRTQGERIRRATHEPRSSPVRPLRSTDRLGTRHGSAPRALRAPHSGRLLRNRQPPHPRPGPRPPIR